MFIVDAVVAYPFSALALVAGGSVLGWFLKKTFGTTSALETAASSEAAKLKSKSGL